MKILGLIAIAATVASAAPALAVNSFQNGGFETLTNGTGQLISGFTSAPGWTVGNFNYTFVFGPGDADTVGSQGIYGGLSLWGPNNGSNNGLPASSPSGGNFIAMDGNFPGQPTGPLEQVITGLVAGARYKVGFDYAFAQQAGFDGPTEQNWTVNFAGQSYTTQTFALANHAFSGWFNTAVTFVAGPSGTETLQFIAYGNVPVPPFALLDGVTFAAVPEPSSWAMLLVGFGIVGVAARRRKAAIAA